MTSPLNHIPPSQLSIGSSYQVSRHPTASGQWAQDGHPLFFMTVGNLSWTAEELILSSVVKGPTYQGDCSLGVVFKGTFLVDNQTLTLSWLWKGWNTTVVWQELVVFNRAKQSGLGVFPKGFVISTVFSSEASEAKRALNWAKACSTSQVQFNRFSMEVSLVKGASLQLKFHIKQW